MYNKRVESLMQLKTGILQATGCKIFCVLVSNCSKLPILPSHRSASNLSLLIRNFSPRALAKTTLEMKA